MLNTHTKTLSLRRYLEMNEAQRHSLQVHLLKVKSRRWEPPDGSGYRKVD